MADPVATLSDTHSMLNGIGLVDRMMLRQRRRLFNEFLTHCCPVPSDTILDIGVTADDSFEAANHLLKWYAHPDQVTGLGLDVDGPLNRRTTSAGMVRADGRCLPFADNSYDWVHSNAVIEHTGNDDQQQAFVAEQLRVARKGVFITTPNRWFPVELHTAIPLMHWLPKSWHRAFLRAIGQPDLAKEAHLNLQSSATLACMGDKSGGYYHVGKIPLFVGHSNLFLVAYKLPQFCTVE